MTANEVKTSSLNKQTGSRDQRLKHRDVTQVSLCPLVSLTERILKRRAFKEQTKHHRFGHDSIYFLAQWVSLPASSALCSSAPRPAPSRARDSRTSSSGAPPQTSPGRCEGQKFVNVFYFENVTVHTWIHSGCPANFKTECKTLFMYYYSSTTGFQNIYKIVP